MALLVLLIPLTSLPARGIEMGPLTPFLSPGNQGAWTLSADGVAVLLENSAARGDITYYFAKPKPDEQGQRDVSVDVSLVRAGAQSFAGLLYGYQEGPKSYYIFAVQGGRSVGLFERTDAGFRQRFSTQIDTAPGKAIRLTIRERGNSIALLVNGREVSNIGNDSIGRGAVGIAAGDVGNYRFSGFSVQTNAQQSRQAPSMDRPQRLANAPQGSPARQATSGLKVIEEVDPALRMVSIRMSIPADWEKPASPSRNKEGVPIAFQSASGVVVLEGKVRATQIASGDPALDQFARSRNQVVENYVPLESLVKPLLLAESRKNGSKLIRSYKVPELLNFHRQELHDNAWYQNRFDTFAIDWDLGNGKHAAHFAVEVLSVPTQRSLRESLNGRAHTGRLIAFRYIEAPAALFAQARDAYIASIANIEINAVWLRLAQRKQQEIMAGIEAKGRAAVEGWKQAEQAEAARGQALASATSAANAAQSQIGKTYSDILDISHSGYMARSNVQYAGHQSVIRGIHERTIIGSSNSGERYSVHAGSKHYWANPATGEYLGTDNSLFDPRKNNQLPGQWERMGEQR